MTVFTTSINGLECVVLESEHLSATVCPAAGGKISSLILKNPDTELLWNNPGLSLRSYPAGTEYDPHFFGGIDELLPNDEKENIGGAEYPDHGELWTSNLKWEQCKNGIRLHTVLPISGLEYEKTMTLDEHCGQLRMEYEITNLKAMQNYFLLKMHAALRLHKGDRLICDAERGEIGDPDFTGRKAARFFDWPRYGEERLDIVGGPEECRNEFFFLHELKRGEMRMESPEAGTFFTYGFDTAVFPYAWYFASYGGWNGLYTGVLEPASAVPCSLGTSIKNSTCSTLAPGAKLNTVVTINIGRLA